MTNFTVHELQLQFDPVEDCYFSTIYLEVVGEVVICSYTYKVELT